MSENFSILNLTKSKNPMLALPIGRQAFALMKNDILGKNYELSLVFITPKKSLELNRLYRKKNKPANVLSFPYSKKEGEIFISSAVAKTQAKDFEKTWQEFVGFLVIHGMLHLKGMRHSSTMSKAEKKYDTKYLHWNRPRHHDHPRRRR